MVKFGCWKKDSSLYPRMTFKRTGDRNKLIINQTDGKTFSGKDWFIVYKDYSDNFKTRAEALKVAKDFMRRTDKKNKC